MGAAWNSTGPFGHLERTGCRGLKPEEAAGQGAFWLVFPHQEMSPFCWEGLIRNGFTWLCVQVGPKHHSALRAAHASWNWARSRKSTLSPPYRRKSINQNPNCGKKSLPKYSEGLRILYPKRWPFAPIWG